MCLLRSSCLCPFFLSYLHCKGVCIYIYIYIYTHAVEFKTGPIFALFCVKNWSKLFFRKFHSPCRKKSIQKNTKNNDPILVLKIGPIMLRNMLEPVFNTTLDQFITQDFLFFLVLFLLLKPLFLSCFQ